MILFRVLSVAGFVGVFIGIIAHRSSLKKRDIEPGGFWRWLGRQPGEIFMPLNGPDKGKPQAIFNAIARLLYFIVLICTLLLIITGFLQPIVLGTHISGYFVMVHAVISPVFAVCAALLALLWAHETSFNSNDWAWLQAKNSDGDRNEAQYFQGVVFGQKVFFWLMVLFSIPVILSIILTMYPLAGTEGQELLIGMHRYCSLLLALSVMIHAYLTAVKGNQSRSISASD